MNRLAAVLSALTIFMLISIKAFADESHITIPETAKSEVVQLFNLSQEADMYVKVSYRGDSPSVAIISPIGIPCDIVQASPEYSKNVITYRIPSAAVGQWHLHILADATESYEISYGRLKDLHNNEIDTSIIIVMGIIFCIILVFTCYCFYRYKKLSSSENGIDIKHE